MKKTPAQRKTHVSATKYGRCCTAQLTLQTWRSLGLHLESIEVRDPKVTTQQEKNIVVRSAEVCAVTKLPADSDVDVNLYRFGKKRKRIVRLSQWVIDDGFLTDESIEDLQASYNTSGEDSEEEEIEEKSMVKSLSLAAEAKKVNLCLTEATWPHRAISKNLTWTAEPFPFSSSQPKATKNSKVQTAHDHKQVDETPIWADIKALVLIQTDTAPTTHVTPITEDEDTFYDCL
ncbi:hypothetical protein BD769DRAFT_1393452 [Suillus cothurnatus]|nr:hypothetical protein BD769DRAFT_1393452 [Suillus cothurnatus]